MLRSSVYREDDYHMLQQKIIHLNSELSRYKAKVKEYQDDYHYSQLEILKEENQRLKNDLDETAESREEERKAFARKLEENYQNRLTSISQLDGYIAELEEEISDSDKRIEELEKELHIRAGEEDRLKAELARFKGENLHEQEDVIRMKSELEKIKKALENSRDDHDFILSDRNRLLKENDHLVKMQKTTMSELKNLHTKIGTARRDYVPPAETPLPAAAPPAMEFTETRNRLKELQTRVSDYENSISVCLQQISELEEQIGLLSAIIIKMEAISPESSKHH
ncbi:hypothetical protein KZX50_15830 [Bacillus infantis]|uniref:hypothetical protein n=1 Tax=Bacillus infantis TaxID=324767 RepID=UPI000B9B210F|nr:hypothetical protein [Bacillus infantis]MCK6206916.1 hypothetical protein [Bacillus infantis]OXT14667.1 hypothetical protein B9K06_25150 [Bacillus sp. OG2]